MVFDDLTQEQQTQVIELETAKSGEIAIDIDRNIELENEKFKVIEYLKQVVGKEKKSYGYYYILVCKDCGAIKKINKQQFKDHNTCQKCNTLKNQKEFEGFENIAYIVLKYDHTDDKRKLYYLCKCKNCGAELVVRKDNILKTEHCHCVKCKGNGVTPTETGPLNVYKYYYKEGAASRNFTWELTDDQFKYIVSKPCHYCGANPRPIQSLRRYTHIKEEINVNGIDRVDSSKGYSINNCVPCCSMCNKMKLDYKLDEFINHVHKIANYYKSSTTIPQGSTEQTNGSGNGEIPEKGCDIV